MKGKFRQGVFLIVRNKEKYLLLKRKLHWRGWEFPKGGIEPGENILHGVKRELKEETGLRIKKVVNMKKSGKFLYDRKLADRPGISGMTWKLFLIDVYPGKIKLDKKEHSAYSWLDYEKAIKKLTWPNQKKCLRIVNSKIV